MTAIWKNAKLRHLRVGLRHCEKGRIFGCLESCKEQGQWPEETGAAERASEPGSKCMCACLYAYKSMVDLIDTTKVLGSVQ